MCTLIRSGITAVTMCLIVTATAVAREGSSDCKPVYAYHNGSIMAVKFCPPDFLDFFIWYEKPRPGMRHLVSRGDPLVRAKLNERTGFLIGTAYVFSSRCGPMPYTVVGHIDRYESAFTLYGRAPKPAVDRFGICYDGRTFWDTFDPNDTLVFTRLE